MQPIRNRSLGATHLPFLANAVLGTNKERLWPPHLSAGIGVGSSVWIAWLVCPDSFELLSVLLTQRSARLIVGGMDQLAGLPPAPIHLSRLSIHRRRAREKLRTDENFRNRPRRLHPAHRLNDQSASEPECTFRNAYASLKQSSNVVLNLANGLDFLTIDR